jgi:hypothetical protein
VHVLYEHYITYNLRTLRGYCQLEATSYKQLCSDQNARRSCMLCASANFRHASIFGVIPRLATPDMGWKG